MSMSVNSDLSLWLKLLNICGILRNTTLYDHNALISISVSQVGGVPLAMIVYVGYETGVAGHKCL